jgi:signal transduction histidine kinase
MVLKIIYTRVQALQGSIDISSEPSKGTSISMEFMLKETEDK